MKSKPVPTKDLILGILSIVIGIVGVVIPGIPGFIMIGIGMYLIKGKKKDG